MQCNILKNLYVKSNGDIRCDDDFGERMLLGKVTSSSAFSPTQLFKNSQYTKIRRSFALGLPPWGEVCENCAFFRDGQIDETVFDKRISKVQLEPTLLCALRCPDCSRINQIKAGRKPLVMTTMLLEVFLKGLIEEGYSVERFELCGQGEPLNHPELNTLINLINRYFPKSAVCLVTNGNFDAFKCLNYCELTEIIVSVDGVSQRSYEQYRVNGKISKCMTFMRKAREMFPDARLIWKYVLFSHNDSDEEIIEAQKLAKAIRVDELRFINTTYGPHSTRLQSYNEKPLPILTNLVTVDSHAFIPNTLSVMQVVTNDRAWRKWWVNDVVIPLCNIIRPSLKRGIGKLWPSNNHKIEKVSLVKEDDLHMIFIDGWAKEKQSIILSYADKQKTIKRAYSKRHISFFQRIKGKFGYRPKPSFKIIGFRECFCVDNRKLDQDIQIDVINKRMLFSSRVSYQLKKQDVITIRQS